MSKLLMKKTETYRVDTEEEAIKMIEDFRAESRNDVYEVSKASYTKKNKKVKGEIVEEWVVAEVTFVYEI